MGGGLGFPTRLVLILLGVGTFLYLAVFYLRHSNRALHKYALPMGILALGLLIASCGDGLTYFHSTFRFADTLMVVGAALVVFAVGLQVQMSRGPGNSKRPRGY